MLKLQNVTMTFNKEMSKDLVKVALDNVSLQINKGDFVTIIGSNGSGKTTLLNVISGVHKIDNGEILLNNKNINNLKALKPDAQCCLVITGPGIKTVVGDGTISKLLEKKVSVKACQNSLDHFEIDKGEIISGVEVVPAGILSLIELQNAGFAYIKP